MKVAIQSKGFQPNSVSAAMSKVTLDLPFHISAEEARRLLRIKEAERISLDKAAELAGYSKRVFMELLAKEGIPVINYAPEELDRELEP
jgi:predicted HTH domain antitoxin